MDIVDIAIAKKLAGGGGGGSSLPSVTSADAGKVLAVNGSGEWAAEEKIVFISATTEDNVETLNKTAQELYDLMSSGAIVLLPLTYYDNEDNFGAIYQIVTDVYNAYGYVVQVWGREEVITYECLYGNEYPSRTFD